MKLVSIYILSFLISFAVMAQECQQENSAIYNSYLSDLRAGSNTIQWFNLPFLATELEKSGIKKNQISNRLSKYTLALDQLNSKVKIEGIYTPRISNCDFFVYKISGVGRRYDNYAFVRLVENKIINISFEENSTELDGKKLSQLLFVEVM